MSYISLRISALIYKRIITAFKDFSSEKGGIIGHSNGTINAFSLDINEDLIKDEYIPNVSYLNEVICEWHTSGIEFLGFVHTHPSGNYRLSDIDKKYAVKILENNNTINELLLGIVVPEDKNIYWWSLSRKECRFNYTDIQLA